MRGYTFDAGAFIALERRSRFMIGILEDALQGAAEVVMPRTVIAQIWRGMPKQAHVSRLISAGLRHGGQVVIDELTAERAREIGIAIGRTSRADIVDVHVALVAGERGNAVLTSDDNDIRRVDRSLVIIHV